MGLIIEGLFALCLILLVFWLIGLRKSAGRDQADAEAWQAQEQATQEQAAQEARLLSPGEKLRCLSCDHTFLGPLPDTGCPHCHLSSFVVPEGAQHPGQPASQTIGFRRKEE